MCLCVAATCLCISLTSLRKDERRISLSRLLLLSMSCCLVSCLTYCITLSFFSLSLLFSSLLFQCLSRIPLFTLCFDPLRRDIPVLSHLLPSLVNFRLGQQSFLPFVLLSLMSSLICCTRSHSMYVCLSVS